MSLKNMPFIPKHQLIKTASGWRETGVTSPFSDYWTHQHKMWIFHSCSQGLRQHYGSWDSVRLLQHKTIYTFPLSHKHNRASAAWIRAPGFTVFEGQAMLILSVSQSCVSGGWTGALRYLHWIHTLYMVSCLPLFTCSRRSTRFCTFSSPASVNMSWSSSGTKRRIEIFSHM